MAEKRRKGSPGRGNIKVKGQVSEVCLGNWRGNREDAGGSGLLWWAWNGLEDDMILQARGDLHRQVRYLPCFRLPQTVGTRNGPEATGTWLGAAL